MGVLEKISEIEKEIARTQKNKGICFTYVEKIFIFEQIHLSENAFSSFKMYFPPVQVHHPSVYEF